MTVQHKGYRVNFKTGCIIRNRDSMKFNFKYTAKGVSLEPVAQSMLPSYIKKWVINNAADFLAIEYP